MASQADAFTIATRKYIEANTKGVIDHIFQTNPLLIAIRARMAAKAAEDYDDFYEFVMQTRREAGIEDPNET